MHRMGAVITAFRCGILLKPVLCAVYQTLDKKEFSNAGVAKAGFCGVSRTQNAYFPHASAAYSLLRTCSVKTSLPMTAPTIGAFSSKARESLLSELLCRS
jgi:hypothetical protein